MKLSEFTKIAEHIQSHFAEPFNVTDSSCDSLDLSNQTLDVEAAKTVNGIRYSINARVRAGGECLSDALIELRSKFDEAINPQERMTSESEIEAAIAVIRKHDWCGKEATIDAFCDALFGVNSVHISTMFATPRYFVTIKKQPNSAPTAEENHE